MLIMQSWPTPGAWNGIELIQVCVWLRVGGKYSVQRVCAIFTTTTNNKKKKYILATKQFSTILSKKERTPLISSMLMFTARKTPGLK